MIDSLGWMALLQPIGGAWEAQETALHILFIDHECREITTPRVGLTGNIFGLKSASMSLPRCECAGSGLPDDVGPSALTVKACCISASLAKLVFSRALCSSRVYPRASPLDGVNRRRQSGRGAGVFPGSFKIFEYCYICILIYSVSCPRMKLWFVSENAKMRGIGTCVFPDGRVRI